MQLTASSSIVVVMKLVQIVYVSCSLRKFNNNYKTMSVFNVREIERKADLLGRCEVISYKENNHIPYVWLTGFANWLSSRFLRIEYCKTMWRSWGRLSHCMLQTWFNPLLSSSKRGCFDGKLMTLARCRPWILHI